MRTGLEVIANHLGKRLDEDNPLLHAQLPDGSRIAAVIPPVVRSAPALTIRKFTSRRFTIDDLIARGTLSRSLADYLSDQIRNGETILISGGTGTGKTTLLNILAQAIPAEERIVVIEDTAELRIEKPNVLAAECQTDTFKARISFDDLLKSALRWRPDRIILGEVRGTEARTLLDSFNTGHAGSLATIHANSAEKALHRFANLVMRSHAQSTFTDTEAEIAEAVATKFDKLGLLRFQAQAGGLSLRKRQFRSAIPRQTQSRRCAVEVTDICKRQSNACRIICGCFAAQAAGVRSAIR
jgi:pilus assembly protein CpaF